MGSHGKDCVLTNQNGVSSTLCGVAPPSSRSNNPLLSLHRSTRASIPVLCYVPRVSLPLLPGSLRYQHPASLSSPSSPSSSHFKVSSQHCKRAPSAALCPWLPAAVRLGSNGPRDPVKAQLPLLLLTSGHICSCLFLHQMLRPHRMVWASPNPPADTCPCFQEPLAYPILSGLTSGLCSHTSISQRGRLAQVISFISYLMAFLLPFNTVPCPGILEFTV